MNEIANSPSSPLQNVEGGMITLTEGEQLSNEHSNNVEKQNEGFEVHTNYLITTNQLMVVILPFVNNYYRCRFF